MAKKQGKPTTGTKADLIERLLKPTSAKKGTTTKSKAPTKPKAPAKAKTTKATASTKRPAPEAGKETVEIALVGQHTKLGPREYMAKDMQKNLPLRELNRIGIEAGVLKDEDGKMYQVLILPSGTIIQVSKDPEMNGPGYLHVIS